VFIKLCRPCHLVIVMLSFSLTVLEAGASGGPAKAPGATGEATVNNITAGFPGESGGVELPSARLAFQGSSYGFIFGGSSGQGTLNYNEEDFPFSISGKTLGIIGSAKIDAIGVVYNLDDVGFFPGTYKSTEGNLTLGSGGGSARLTNEHNVVIELQMLNSGAAVALGGSRYQIAFE
jgi:hypothetical protein